MKKIVKSLQFDIVMSLMIVKINIKHNYARIIEAIKNEF